MRKELQKAVLPLKWKRQHSLLFQSLECFIGTDFGGGDDLSGIEWNNRSWISREKIRTNLVDLCLKIAVEL